MDRYTTDSFTTASIAGGSSLDIDRVISSINIDIVKIKIVPSDGSGTNVFELFKAGTRFQTDRIYTTDAFPGVLFVDPPDSGGAEKTQGSLVPYYDSDKDLKLHLTITNNDVSAKTYDVTIVYEAVISNIAGMIGSPDGGSVNQNQSGNVGSGGSGSQQTGYKTGAGGAYGAQVSFNGPLINGNVIVGAFANGLDILAGVSATGFTTDITLAEIRATYIGAGDYASAVDMRTVAEGGTWVPNGTTRRQFTNIPANQSGAQAKWTSAAQGRWYVCGRVQNSTGWSLWSDGNQTPQNVTYFVDTLSITDSGPPADWDVNLEQGPVPNTVVVRAKRPKTNAGSLLWFFVQIKDASTGQWRALDANTGAAVTLYDGSAVSHTLTNGYLTKATAGWGAVTGGCLILVDRRPGNFDVNHCQWFWIGPDNISGNTLYLGPNTGITDGTADLRVKILKHYIDWTTEGYLGAEANRGGWPAPGSESAAKGGLGLSFIAGDPSQEFVTTPIAVPSGVTNVEARVFFGNQYSLSDDGVNHSSGSDGGPGVIVSPRVFTDFNNRRYWLPAYPDANYGALTFNADGSVVAQVLGTSESTHDGICGIRARFRLHASSVQEAGFRVKFTDLNLPVGLASGDRLVLGVFLCDGENSYGSVVPGGVRIIGTQTKVAFGAGSNPALAFTSTVGHIDIFGMGYNAYTTANDNRPVAGSILEIICNYYALGSFSGQFAMQSLQWRLGGSGSYTTTTYGIVPRPSWWGFRGADIFIGWIGNCRLDGASATIVEAQLLKGLGEIF